MQLRQVIAYAEIFFGFTYRRCPVHQTSSLPQPPSTARKPSPTNCTFQQQTFGSGKPSKKNSAWSIIQTLFEKSFPQNELPPVKHLIRTVQKNYFPFKKNSMLRAVKIPSFCDATQHIFS